MNLNNAYPLFQEITSSTAQLEQHKADLHGIKTSQSIWSIATFFIYLSFTSVLFAGVSVFALQDYLFANKTNVVGMLWVIIVTLSVPAALSLAKHFNYKAIAKDGFNDRRKIQTIIYFIIALAIISGIYYESISASTNLQVKSFHAADNSAMGKSLTSATIVNSGASGMAESIAKAQKSYNACLVKLEQAKKTNPETKFHCNGDKGMVDSLKEQANAERASNAEATSKAQAVNHELMKAERTEQAIPPAKFASQIFNTSIDGGVMIITLIAALLLELIHVTTIFNESRTLKNIRHYTDMLKDLNGSYFKMTGKTFSPDDFTDDRVIDLSKDELNRPTPNNPETFNDDGYEIRTKGKPYSDSKIGFGNPATASRFKWQDSEIELPAKPERTFGFIPSRSSESLAAENRRKYPQEIVMPMTDRPTPHDYGAVPRKDANLGTHKPLGQATRRLGIPSQPSLDEATRTNGESSLDDRLKRVSDELYPAWIQVIKAKEITNAKEPTQKFIWKHDQRGEGLTVLSANETQRIWIEWQSRALCDGVLVANPKYQPGNRQAKYLLA
ncbi:hypothetical protein [Thiothrix winogradskyi]|uniref:Uncharacterized protein n=1 Tax=Thiothrix winogradskyi TaxID=96472 RepID=A0ABY3SWM2_9GAMM|nr:hypothetical protein [Thiothrix winogradskyi]UJS23887.1 hypothetical protein L2Y54_18395 [Thiothrix winogradskyi]